MCTQVKALFVTDIGLDMCTNAEKETRYIQYTKRKKTKGQTNTTQKIKDRAT
jgi:hypothetical protein